MAEMGAMAKSETICRISAQKSARGVRKNSIAKTRAATIDVAGAEISAIPKSRKYVKKNIGDVKPPVVKSKRETAKENTKISKTTLEVGFKNFFLIKKETIMYKATITPEI